jgi:hypothetical protein
MTVLTSSAVARNPIISRTSIFPPLYNAFLYETRRAMMDQGTSIPAGFDKSSTPKSGLREDWVDHATAVFTGPTVGKDQTYPRSSILYHLYNACS